MNLKSCVICDKLFIATECNTQTCSSICYSKLKKENYIERITKLKKTPEYNQPTRV